MTEDSNSGHDIVEHIVSIPVKAADGKDNVVNTIDHLRWGTLNNMFKSERCLKEISGQLSDLDGSVKEI